MKREKALGRKGKLAFIENREKKTENSDIHIMQLKSLNEDELHRVRKGPAARFEGFDPKGIQSAHPLFSLVSFKGEKPEAVILVRKNENSYEISWVDIIKGGETEAVHLIWLELELMARELKLNAQMQTRNKKVMQLGINEAEDLNRIAQLKKGEVYTDRSGNTIPYERKKKFLGTRKEKLTEYRNRVRSDVMNDYTALKERQYFPVARTLQVQSYYSDQEALNLVSPEHVNRTFSEQRRQMMKKALVQMARADIGKESEAKPLFNEFLNNVIEYGNLTGDYSMYRDEEGSLRERILEERDGEIAAFQKAKNNLDKLIELYKDTEEGFYITYLRGYQSLLSGLSDGNLTVPENAEIIKLNRRS
ncbi:MAG TPA: hypothetical protein DCL38_10000 [Lachnospiraceae bacterium]|nr:hypothetical protein [Lachnospiraceae bacterium]